MADAVNELTKLIPILRNERTNLVLAPYQKIIMRLRSEGKTYQVIADAITKHGIPCQCKRYEDTYKETESNDAESTDIYERRN